MMTFLKGGKREERGCPWKACSRARNHLPTAPGTGLDAPCLMELSLGKLGTGDPQALGPWKHPYLGFLSPVGGGFFSVTRA